MLLPSLDRILRHEGTCETNRLVCSSDLDISKVIREHDPIQNSKSLHCCTNTIQSLHQEKFTRLPPVRISLNFRVGNILQETYEQKFDI